MTPVVPQHSIGVGVLITRSAFFVFGVAYGFDVNIVLRQVIPGGPFVFQRGSHMVPFRHELATKFVFGIQIAVFGFATQGKMDRIYVLNGNFSAVLTGCLGGPAFGNVCCGIGIVGIVDHGVVITPVQFDISVRFQMPVIITRESLDRRRTVVSTELESVSPSTLHISSTTQNGGNEFVEIVLAGP